MLDKNFIAMANFAMFSATGKNGEIDKNVDLNIVLKYASEQAIIPLVATGIIHYSEKFNLESSVVEKLQSIVLQIVANNIKNSYIIKNIFEKFVENNIDYAILKGESIAALYNEPELRISGDVDVLVLKTDETRVLKILEKFDYSYEKRPSWGNETVAKHKNYKTIEVHTSLFDESRNDIFFKNLVNEPECFTTIISANLGNISVLSPNDGIMFVFLHFVKHFLSSGAGIRQLIDVVIYAKHYINEIDWDVFYDKLKKLRYYNLFSNLISIAVLYLGIPQTDLPAVEIDGFFAEKILEDMQIGGIFGYNEKELAQFKQVYEKKRFESFMSGDYSLYENRYRKKLTNNLFPNMSYMKNKYSYIKKYPALILFGYLHRIFGAVLNILRKKRKISDFSRSNIATENEKINDRMKLIEELGLI